MTADLHIGINLVYLVPGETGGMEVYARQLIPALREVAPEVRITAFVNREAAADHGPWGELVPAVNVPVNARNRLDWVRGEQHLLPRLAARAGIDVLHSLGSTSPVWGSFRRVVTIHDLIYRHYPATHGGLRAVGMRVLVGRGAHRAHRVLTSSESARADVTRLLHVPPGKVDVVPLGVAHEPNAPATPAAELRELYRVGDRPLVLTVSAKRPHKNLGRLLEALASIDAARRPVLVMPGYATSHERDLRSQALALGIEEQTRFPGWVPAEELEGLYRTSDAFVFPSLYEGFGLPVLEAMEHGLPVACSGRSSIAEVVGDAALVFDPDDPRSIADAIERLLKDRATAERLRAAGLAQAARFSWRRTAEGTLETYRRAAAPDQLR